MYPNNLGLHQLHFGFPALKIREFHLLTHNKG